LLFKIPQLLSVHILIYGVISKDACTTIILAAQNDRKQTLKKKFETQITTFFVGWQTTW